jgi:hypothetical protein
MTIPEDHIDSHIYEAFGLANDLRHDVTDAIGRSLAAEVQANLAAARRALDAYRAASNRPDRRGA